MIHLPVFKKEVLEYLDPKPNQNFIDATAGGGGHLFPLLEKIAPQGKVLAIELDSELYNRLEKGRPERLVLVNDSYSNLKKIAKREGFEGVSGILFDLGLSAWHLKESKRGFSFKTREPLDMRYSQKSGLTAGEIVNSWSFEKIENILKEYGQERFAGRIAKGISQQRKIKPIETTSQLVEIIAKATPGFYKRGRIHFATRTFQALRIAVNNELANLENVLPQTLEVLKKGGRLAIISFHSLEDRIVKNFFREKEKENILKILTKKPITPAKREIRENPSSRSAKLRAAQLT